MLNRPEFIYCLQEDTSYTISPPGQLDVPRLINGQPAWEISSQVKKPKTLVLADWTAKNWTYTETEKIISMLRPLMEEGFSLYIWQKNKIKPLTKEALSSLHYKDLRDNMTFASQDRIAQQATLNRIPKAELLILDDHLVASLLDNSLPIDRSRKLKYSDLDPLNIDIRAGNPIFSDNKTKQYISAHPSAVLTNDIYYYSEYKDRDIVKKNITNQYEILHIANNYIQQFINKTISMSDKNGFSLNNIKKIRTCSDICDNKKIYISDIIKLCQATPKLNTLQCDQHIHYAEITHTIFPNVENLNLEYCESSVSLSQMIRCFPNLKTLAVRQTKNYFGSLSLEKNSLSSLRELELNDFSDPNDCLAFTPQLKKLVINTDFESIKTPLPELEELILKKSFRQKIPDDSASDLDPIEFDIDPDTPSYNSGLSPSEGISRDFSKTLHEIAPKLKKITFHSDFDFVGFLNPDEILFPTCEEINISECRFKVLDIEKITSHSPKLKKLVVSNEMLRTLKKDPLYPRIQHLLETQINFSDLPDLSLDPNDEDFITPFETKHYIEPRDFEPIQQDPVHRPEAMQEFKPPEDFKFRGVNKTKNQGMIIEKLSQYWTLSDQNTALIAKIQVGICTALSQLYLEKSNEWDKIVEPISAWDGTKKGLENNPELENAFTLITKAVEQYQLFNPFNSNYVGNNLTAFLNERKPSLISNPWHTIAIVPEDKETWTIYDPNYIDGPKRVSESELKATFELRSILKTQIGRIISITSLDKNPSMIPPGIPSAHDFIEQGGLLALCNSTNKTDMLARLKELNETLPPAAFDGLFLRDTKGIPAWAIGLKDPIVSAYTFDLLQQYIKHFPDDAVQKLQKSLFYMEPKQQHSIIELLHTQMSSTTQTTKTTKSSTSDIKESKEIDVAPLSIFEELINKLNTNPYGDYYEKRLETWKKPLSKISSLPEYMQQLTAKLPNENSILVQLKSSQSVQGMQLALQKYCNQTKRPVFYIHSPNDLVCSARWIRRDEKNQGVIQKPPGGALYDFLQKHQNEDPVLIVNYDNFSPADIVRFNTLLDKTPSADGTSLPSSTKVIGLMDTNKPDCYSGSDFYSRFSTIDACSIPEKTLSAPNLPFVAEAQNPFVIDLYDNTNWETGLLGFWKMQEDRLIFEEGPLLRALKEKQSVIEIKNAPWHNPAFQHFWQQACHVGHVLYANQKIEFSAELTLIKSQGYDWTERKNYFSFDTDTTIQDIPVLNPSLFNDFFSQYTIDNQKHTLNTTAGWIEQFRGKTLEVVVTRSLSEGQWAKLADLCKTHEVKLILHCTPSVILPNALRSDEIKPLQKELKVPEHTQILCSNDLDATIEMLSKKDKYRVIDVSECSPSDLLKRITAKWDEEKYHYQFSQSACALLQLTEQKDNIILKGQFSPELIDALHPFLLKRLSNTDAPQKLIFLSDENPFSFLPASKLQVSEQEKMALLGKEIDDKITNQPKPFCQLKALTAYKTLSINNEPWAGLHTLPNLEKKKEKIDYVHSKEIADTFSKKRLDEVNSVLSIAPYVFLTGQTGVGKSTFVQKDFLAQLKLETPLGKLFQSEAEIKQWATDQSEGRKILFIDEANLSLRQWSEFEGLFHSPPSILIDGELCPLTKNHQVIFAGNPISYGDERRLAPFFERHGNTVFFPPLPPEYIFQHILKPIWQNTPLETHQELASQFLLKLYYFLGKCAHDKVIISPRELEMMALLIVSEVVKNSYTHEKDIINVAEHFVYTLGKNLVPPAHQYEFHRSFKPTIDLFPKHSSKTVSGFLMTRSRQPIENFLNQSLFLRELRMKENKSLSDGQCYGGLGGLILEGSPASGKSELVVATLRDRGYVEKHLNSPFSEEQKIFYRVPVSMNKKEKEALLLKAFNEGAVVIIDEINSSPLMEALLNTLTMGRAPNGERPTRPGFTIIGTQNPITMAGRRAPSPALARRFTTMSVPDYTTKELHKILITKGAHPELAEYLVDVFEMKLKQAKEEQLYPAPTLRDVIKLVDETPSASKKLLWVDVNYEIRQAPLLHQWSLSNSKKSTTENESISKFSQKKLPGLS